MLFVAKIIFKNHKIIMYKHIRFKSSAKNFNADIAAEEVRIQYLSETLKCSAMTAKKIATKNRNIFALDSHDFILNVKFCSEHLKLSDLIEFPYVINFNPSLLQHRYFSLKEVGFCNVTASHILKFPQLLKRTPESLISEGISFSLEHQSDILKHYLTTLERRDVESNLHHMYRNGSNLSTIKENMNAEYLSAKLNCSLGRAHEMFRCYPPLRVQSILNTDHLLNFLLCQCEFSVNKVFSSASILSLHFKTVEYFFSELPKVLGVDTAYLVQKIPVLLRRSVTSVRSVEQILKEFDITDAQLICCPKVAVFSPKTLQQRLTALCESEDFSILKSYKKFLWLVYYFNNLNSRLETLKRVDIPSSISMFTVSKSVFNKYLYVTQCRTHINDVSFYLAQIFNVSEADIMLKLKAYPSTQNASLSNCRKVVEFLLASGVTKKQLYNGIGIVFYRFEVVKMYFEDMKHNPDCQPFSEWILHYNLIQLLIYVIEVDTGFQGSHVYKSKPKIEHEEETLVADTIF